MLKKKAAIIGPLGLAQPSLYLGQIATRCYMNSAVTASTSGWNSVTTHYAHDDVVDPQLIFGNFRVQAGVGEVGNGGNIQTNTASIEWPFGTRRQAFSGGSTQLVLPELTYGYMNTSIFIPRGNWFRVRRYQVNTVGLFFSASGERKLNNAFGLDAVQNISTDMTMSGSPAGGGGIIAPQGIVAMTRRPSIGVLGSSRTTGARDLVVDAGGDTGYTRFYGPYFPYLDYSVAGDKSLSVAGAGGLLRREIIWKHCSNLGIDPGLNDLLGGTQEQVLVDTILGTADSFPGGRSRVFVNDEAPNTQSPVDHWTTNNQNVIGIEGSRVALNNHIAAFQGFNQILRPSLIAGNGLNNQFWNNPVVGGFQWTDDGLHELTAGLIAEKNAGVFNPALVRR